MKKSHKLKSSGSQAGNASLLWLIILLGLGLAGCSQAPRHFTADQYPERLSEWGLVDTGLKLAPDSMSYQLNTALFSDYAEKQRSLYLPPGTQAHYRDYEAFEFPVGTVVSKTFYYRANAAGQIDLSGGENEATQLRLVETRLLVKQAEGWDALPYVWQGDDAYLAITGKLIRLSTLETDTTQTQTINYLVPSKNQCASCHATNHSSGAIQPIGLKARHLNRSHGDDQQNQLDKLEARGWLTGLPPASQRSANADFSDPTLPVEHRARSYLDINCGHCHNPQGAADTSGLLLDYQGHTAREMGTCKPPIAAGRGSGGLNFSIVPGQPQQSILAFRMASRDPAAMMPELGRTLAHAEGVELINAWISQLPGECR